MAKYINLDKIRSSAHIASFIAEQDLENGCFVTLLGREETGEARYAIRGADYTRGSVVLHASNGGVYDRPRQNEMDFVLEAGEIGRAYFLDEGNEVSYTAEAIDAPHELGTILVPAPAGSDYDLTVGTPAVGQWYGEITAIDYNFIAGTMILVSFDRQTA